MGLGAGGSYSTLRRMTIFFVEPLRLTVSDMGQVASAQHESADSCERSYLHGLTDYIKLPDFLNGVLTGRREAGRVSLG